MSEYLLKDSESKRLLAEWLTTSMVSYAKDSALKWSDEDSLCEHFFSINGTLSTPTGEFTIKSYKTRGRGPGAPEKKLGADGIGLVNIQNNNTTLAGFFLFQAKKSSSLSDQLRGASVECTNMLTHTAASYLLALMPAEAKMAGAMAIHSCKRNDPSLTDVPFVSVARFIVEHMLHGLMLEPLHRARDMLTPDLRAEIKHVVGILGAGPDMTTSAMERLGADLESLGLNVNVNKA